MAVYKRTRPDFYICRKSGRSDCGVISTEKHCLPITQEIAELLQPSSGPSSDQHDTQPFSSSRPPFNLGIITIQENL